MTKTLTHAHVTHTTHDCDGTYVSRFVRRPGWRGEASASRAGFVRSVIEAHVKDPLSARFDGSLIETAGGFEWGEDTDEGFQMVEVEWCHNVCPDLHRIEDHSAATAGY